MRSANVSQVSPPPSASSVAPVLGISPRQLDTLSPDDLILEEHRAHEARVLAEIGLDATVFAMGTGINRSLAAAHAASDTPLRHRAVGTLDARPMNEIVSTHEGGDIAEIVNQIEEHPYLFAVRFANLARLVQLMHADLELLKPIVSRLRAHEVV